MHRALVSIGYAKKKRILTLKILIIGVLENYTRIPNIDILAWQYRTHCPFHHGLETRDNSALLSANIHNGLKREAGRAREGNPPLKVLGLGFGLAVKC